MDYSYLPPFLLGSPSTKVQQVSSAARTPLQGISDSGDASYRVFNKSIGVRINLADESNVSQYAKPTSRGPPVQGLHEKYLPYPTETSTPILPVSLERQQLNFSTMNETQMMNKSIQSVSSRRPDIHSPIGNRDLSMPQVSSSPTQVDPFYSRGEEITCDEEFDQRWITVFGFPPSASSYILSQFSQYGDIIKHKVMSSGNWMHILYKSRLDAKKALSKNGKVYGNGIMVGVQQCIDKSVMNESNHYEKVKLSSIRPLTAAYQSSTSQNQVTPNFPNVPQKSSGILSKVMEYVLGW